MLEYVSTVVANTSHIGRVCTTWGNYHWKTFDGNFFHLPSTCNHVLVSQCNQNYEFFNIQMRRKTVNNIPTISSIILKLEGSEVELNKSSVVFNGKRWVQQDLSTRCVPDTLCLICSVQTDTLFSMLGILFNQIFP